jgi:WD40 repeat protein
MKIRNPFKFLDAYTQEDTEIFFGREKETREIHSRLSYRNMLLVYGVSGCGKSSIMQCGLTSIFREELPDGSYTLNWLPLFIRRRENILKAVENAFDEHLSTSLKAQLTLPEKLQHIALKYRREVYLIFDQFEELFIFGSEEEKKNFLSLLKELNQHSNCKIILSIREEYLAALTEFEKELPGLFENRIRIERFTKHTARQLITEPFRVAGIEIEENVPDLILNKLQLSSGLIELTWLQVVMDKLYRQAEKDGSDKPAIKLEHVEKLGKLDNVLSDFLNEQLNLSPDPELYENVLKCLISEEGTKKQARLDEIKNNLTEISSASNLNKNQNKQPGKEITDSELSSILNDLVAKRIIREKDDEGKYELRHDSLAARVYEKLTLYEKDLWAKKKLIELYYQEYRKTRISLNLLSRQVLDVIAPYEQHLLLTKEQREFIQRSRREVLAKRRRARTMAFSAMLLLLIIFAGFTIWALAGQKKARQNEIRFKASYLNSVANELESTDPTKALRLAEAAFELDQSEHIEKNIRRIYVNNSFYKSSILQTFDKRSTIIDQDILLIDQAAFSPDNTCVFVVYSGYHVRQPYYLLWDLKNDLISHLKIDVDINSDNKISINPINKYFLSITLDGSVNLFDFYGSLIKVFVGDFTSFEISADWKIILCHGQASSIDSEHIAVLFNMEGDVLCVIEPVNEQIHSISITPDGKRILGISNSGSFYWWNASGKLINLYRNDTNKQYYDITFSPNNTSFLSKNDNSFFLFDYQGNVIQEFYGHKNFIYKMKFSQDGNIIITVCNNQSIKLWDLLGNNIRTLPASLESAVVDFALSADYSHVLSIHIDGIIRTWRNLGSFKKFHKGVSLHYNNLIFSDDGDYFVAISDNPAKCELFDQNGQWLKTIYQQGSTKVEKIFSACFTMCGRYILIGLCDNTVKKINLDGKIVTNFVGHSEPVFFIESSKYDNCILTGSLDHNVILWDTDGNSICNVNNDNKGISALTFSDESKFLAVGYRSGEIIFIDFDGNIFSRINAHYKPVTHIEVKNLQNIFYTYSKNYSYETINYKLSIGGDNHLKVWSIDGILLDLYLFDFKWYDELFLSIDNNLVFVSFPDHTAKLYDLSMNLLQNISGYGNAITALSISPDGKTLVTAGKDLFVWDRLKSYETFKKEGNYEKLTIADKLEYGLIDYSDLNMDFLSNEIYEASGFLIRRSHRSGSGAREILIEQAYSLMQMLLRKESSTEYLLWTMEINDRLQKINSTRKLIRDEKRLINQLLSITDLNDIEIIANHFESNTSSRDNHSEQIKHYSYAVMFWERIMELYPGEDVTERAFRPYNNLSLVLLYEGRFQESLTMAQKGLNLKNEPSIQTKIALGFLFNNKQEDALELISNYQDTIVNNIPFTTYVLDKMQELKENNVIHPDYDAIVEKIASLERNNDEGY